jgi:hypothetical protein
MGTQTVTRALDASQSTGNARLVLTVLAHLQHDTRPGEGAWPSQQELLRLTRISLNTLVKALKELQRLGEVRVEANAGQSYGGNRTNRYFVLAGLGDTNTPPSSGGVSEPIPPQDLTNTPPNLMPIPPQSMEGKHQENTNKNTNGLSDFIANYPPTSHSVPESRLITPWKNAVRKYGAESVVGAAIAYRLCVIAGSVEPQYVKGPVKFLDDPWAAVTALHPVPQVLVRGGFAWKDLGRGWRLYSRDERCWWRPAENGGWANLNGGYINRNGEGNPGW